MKDTLSDMRAEYARLLEHSLRQIVEKLSMVEEVKRVSVFGSYARGRVDLFTDLDLLVILQTDKGPVERLQMLYSLIAAPVDIDILCYTPQEFEALKDHGFLKQALENELVLVAKPL